MDGFLKFWRDQTKKKWGYRCPQCHSKHLFVSKYEVLKKVENNAPCLVCNRHNYLKKLGITIVSDKSRGGKYHRMCPRCSCAIVYTSKGSAVQTAKDNAVCLDCKSIKRYGVTFDNGVWSRLCPKCNRRIEFSSKSSCLQSVRTKKSCKSCMSISKDVPPSGVMFRKNENPPWGTWYRTCPKCKSPVKCHGKAMAIQKQNQNQLCKKCGRIGMQGKNHSNSAKKLISDQAKKRWNSQKFRKKLNGHVSYLMGSRKHGRRKWNPRVCSYLDKVNAELKDKGIFFRHEKNHSAGEYTCLCYFADGYDETNNIWFEYDEKHHETPNIKKKDGVRERRLIGFLKGRFIRYSEKCGVLYEVLPGGIYKKLSSLV
jgi:DNA-directed RNA polymerase subunit RPC12/RpoP